MGLIRKKLGTKIYKFANQQPKKLFPPNTSSQDPPKTSTSSQKTNPNHLHVLQIKKVLLHLKKNTHAYPNL